MDMVLNNGFCEMTENEMMVIEGGDFWRNLGYFGATVCCIGSVLTTGGLAAVAAGTAAGWYWYDAVR